MKAPRFEYEKPKTLDAALTLLAGASGDAKLLAGGQSLGPMLNLRLVSPDLLIDVRSLPELREMREERDAIVLGASSTHAQIEDRASADPTHRFLATVAHGIAYRAVRNRGTLGGSLAHADPAADWITVMALLDATLIVRSAKGELRIAAANFVTGALTTQLTTADIIVSVHIPKLSARARAAYYKFSRKPGEFAHAIAGVIDDPARGVCRAVIGSTQGAPAVIADAARFIAHFDDAHARATVTNAGFEPGSYQHQVHFVALKRAAARLQ